MFYERFVKLCDENNTKPTPLLKQLGLSAGNLKNWQKGASVNSDILQKLSMHFNVSIDYLVTGKENNSLNKNLSDDQQRLLNMYSLLSDMEKGEILGELKAMTRDRMIEKQESNIQTIRMAARSTDNHPPEFVTGDFSDILNAPDATDEY